MDRGQLSLSALEAGVGVLLILGVTVGFVVGVPQPSAREAQLDAYARDTLTVLSGEPPRHAGASRLAEIAASEEAFDREHTVLERRVERILGDNLLFRVSTPHGTVGYRRPDGVVVGTASVVTGGGNVRIEVWFN